MSQRICKSDTDTSIELAHYAIEKFLTHNRAEELINKKQGMLFLSGVIHRSYHSSTSPYHKLYRQKGIVHELYEDKWSLDKRKDSTWDGYGKYAQHRKPLADMFHIWSNSFNDFKDYEAELENQIDGSLPEDFNHSITWSTNLESIKGIMEDMESDTVEQWFRVVLFKMWLDQPNYSELERMTHIPRTSISQAVKECREYIKQRIENGNNT